MTAIVGVRSPQGAWLACDSAMTDDVGGIQIGQKWVRVGSIVLAMSGDSADIVRIRERLRKARGPRTGTLLGWLLGCWKTIRSTDGVAIGPNRQLCMWDDTNGPCEVDHAAAGSAGDLALCATLTAQACLPKDWPGNSLRLALQQVARIRTDVAGPFAVHCLRTDGIWQGGTG